MLPKYVKFVLKRAAILGITIIVVLTINFIIPRMMPGDPMSDIIARMEESGQGTFVQETIDAYKKQFGLDKDLATQFVSYITQLFQGKLGLSITYFPTDVGVMISRSLPWTIGLLLTTTVLSWVIGNIIGAFVGWSKWKRLNQTLFVAGLILEQFPYYIFALLMVFIFAYVFAIFPAYGGYSIGVVPNLSFRFIADVLYHSMLPALSIIIVAVGGWMTSMRSLIVGIQGEDFLAYAEAKGLKKRTILMKYAFRNALLPQMTSLVLALGFIVNGALILEQVFGYPGMGNLFINSFWNRDYNVMQAVFLFTTIGVLVAAFILDITYPFIDPRVKYSEE